MPAVLVSALISAIIRRDADKAGHGLVGNSAGSLSFVYRPPSRAAWKVPAKIFEADELVRFRNVGGGSRQRLGSGLDCCCAREKMVAQGPEHFHGTRNSMVWSQFTPRSD